MGRINRLGNDVLVCIRRVNFNAVGKRDINAEFSNFYCSNTTNYYT